MSRIGKRPVPFPEGVDVTVSGRQVRVKGPKGDLALDVHSAIDVRIEGSEVRVERPSDSAQHKALHGLTRTLISNMVVGVTQGYKKDLEIVGVGYKAEKSAKGVKLTTGYSHPVQYDAPPGITIDTPTPTTVTISGPTNRWLVRSRRRSARSGRRSLTRARGSGTGASRSGARPARPLERSRWRRQRTAGVPGSADTAASGRRCGARPNVLGSSSTVRCETSRGSSWTTRRHGRCSVCPPSRRACATSRASRGRTGGWSRPGRGQAAGRTCV